MQHKKPQILNNRTSTKQRFNEEAGDTDRVGGSSLTATVHDPSNGLACPTSAARLEEARCPALICSAGIMKWVAKLL